MTLHRDDSEHHSVAPVVGSGDPRAFTDSGIEVRPVYDRSDLPVGLLHELGVPGGFLSQAGSDHSLRVKPVRLTRI